MNHYVYKIIDTVTGEFYFGSRSYDGVICADSYMGSYLSWIPEDLSRLLKQIIRDDFQCRDSATAYESKLIKEHIEDDLNRNCHIPGVGFHTTGYVTVKDPDGKTLNVSLKDKRYTSGELVPTWKGRTHSKETKKKMSEAKRGKRPWNYGLTKSDHKSIEINAINTSDTRKEMFRNGTLSPWNKGLDKHDDQRIMRVSKAMTGKNNPMYGMTGKKNPNYGNKWTDEQKKTQSERFKGKVRGQQKSIIQCDKSGNFIKQWNSLKEASDALGIRMSGISSALTGRYQQSGGFVWVYEKEEINE